MKKLLFLLLLSGTVLTTRAQQPVIKTGSKLTYHVKTNTEQEYDYIVTLKNFGTSVTTFHWQMTEPVNTSGDVTLSAAALKAASSYKNYFSDGSDETLTAQTTVWLSKKNFTDLKAKGSTRMNMTGTPLLFAKTEFPSVSTFSVKGKSRNAAILNVEYAKGDQFYAVRVLNNSINPLITYMELGNFTIELTSID